MKILITQTGQQITAANGREAVEQLSKLGVVTLPASNNYNPSMVMQTPARLGVIKILPDNEQQQVKPDLFLNQNNQQNNMQTTPTQPNDTNVLAQLAQALGQYQQPQQSAAINMEEVEELIKLQIDNFREETKNNIKNINIQIQGRAEKEAGLQHPELETVLQILAVGDAAWLRGPAATGKTTAASIAAKCFEVDFYSLSVCAQSQKSEIFGYMDAVGNYVESLFYKAYKNGGLFLFDEIDNGNPNVLSALNSALSNGHCAFPCGMVERSPNFYCIAAGNTIGTGANQQYIGRNPIDGATMDRFRFVDWYNFEELERHISGNNDWTNKVIKLRKEADKKGLKIIISARASIQGSKLLANGMQEDKVLDVCIFNKCSETEKEILKSVIL